MKDVNCCLASHSRLYCIVSHHITVSGQCIIKRMKNHRPFFGPHLINFTEPERRSPNFNYFAYIYQWVQLVFLLPFSLSLPYFCVCVCRCVYLSVLIKKNNAPTTIPISWETKPSNFVRKLTQIMLFTEMMHLFEPIFTVREYIFVLSLSLFLNILLFSLFSSSFVSYAIWCVNVAHKFNHFSRLSRCRRVFVEN